MEKTLLLILACFVLFKINAQSTKDKVIKSIFDEALTDYSAYNNLETLCKTYPGRITGSVEAAGAVDFTFDLMNDMSLDTVFKQPVQVLRWQRGEDEKAYIVSTKNGKKDVDVISLGTSIGTGRNGLFAEVVEVHNFEELKNLGRENVEGKIVFFNRPMDPTLINSQKPLRIM